MAGFETVVRPIVFPDIRPMPAQQLPVADDPKKDICEIKGAGSFIMNFSSSTSISGSFGKDREIRRRVDTARVYKQNDDGTVDKNNFVDVKVANKIWTRGGTARSPSIADGKPGTSETYGEETRVEYYKPVEEEKNIEIKKRDEIIDYSGPINR